MSELAAYLEKRLAELKPKADELRAQLSPIEAEIDEARRALAAVQRPGVRRQRTGEAGPYADSIQMQALSVISEAPDGLPASHVAEQIETCFGRAVARTSLAPQLSRLVRDGRVKNIGGVYHLAPDIAAAPQSQEAVDDH